MDLGDEHFPTVLVTRKLLFFFPNMVALGAFAKDSINALFYSLNVVCNKSRSRKELNEI